MLRSYILVISTMLLASCSTLNKINPLADEKFNPVGAVPLDEPASFGSSDTEKKAAIAGLVAQSIGKCDTFRKDMVITVDSVDTLSDVMSTTLSALATAFSPIATTHALSAASTIISGNKAAIDSDIYAKASLPNLVTALNHTYYTSIASFNTSIPTLDVSNPGVVVNNLRLIHSQCSLDAIEASIGAGLTSSGNPSTPPAAVAPVVGGTPAPTPLPGDAPVHN